VKALVRRPGPRLGEGIVTHVPRRPVDVDHALEQWHAYVRALADAGWETVEVAPADDCPDAVFVEDTAVVFGDTAIVARPGAPARRAETDAVERTVTELGYRVERITEPGTLDGGDVLTVGETVYVGLSGRTNADGARQLRSQLRALGATVVVVPVTNVLHLKTAVTALPDGTMIVRGSRLPPSFREYVASPDDSGAHLVLLGGGKVLLAADCPRTAELVGARGYEPVVVDISEFQKLEGNITCLSVLLH
jgi:dimethylargininase